MLELLDFKTSRKPKNAPEVFASYERQLCIYAHILERRYRKRPDQPLLYWTSEPLKKDGLMQLPYRPELVEQRGRLFDRVVGKIKAKDFRLLNPSEPVIYKECDLRNYCNRESTIR